MDFRYVRIQSREEKTTIFEDLKKAGLIDVFMYESANPTLEEFLLFAHEKTSILLAVYNAQTTELAAIFLISPQINNSGQYHFCFKKQYFKNVVEIGKNSIEIFWQMGFESLFGITPKCYRHVFKPARLTGFDVNIYELQGMCKIAKTNKLVPGIVSAINKPKQGV